jgi:hypothetical protein
VAYRVRFTQDAEADLLRGHIATRKAGLEIAGTLMIDARIHARPPACLPDDACNHQNQI